MKIKGGKEGVGICKVMHSGANFRFWRTAQSGGLLVIRTALLSTTLTPRSFSSTQSRSAPVTPTAIALRSMQKR